MHDSRYEDRNFGPTWAGKSPRVLAYESFRDTAMEVFNTLYNDPVATKGKQSVKIAGANYVITVEIKDE